MATNSRPRTKINVTYGTLGDTVTAQQLNPVLIAPRYAVHSYVDGYETAFLTSEYAGTQLPSAASSYLDWPGKADESEVDNGSVKLYFKTPTLKLNDTALTGTVDSTNNQLVKVSKDLRSAAELNGFLPAVGDGVEFVVGGSAYDAVITSLQYSYGNATTPTVTGIGTVGAAPVASGTNSGSAKVSYLVTLAVTGTGADQVVMATAIALQGDEEFQQTSFELTTTAVNLGNKGLKLAKATGSSPAAEYVDGNSFKVECDAVSITGLDKVFVNKTLTASSSVTSIQFKTASYSADFMPAIGSSAVTKTTAGVKLAADIRVSVAGKNLLVAGGDAYLNYRELLTEDALTIVASSNTSAADWAGIADPQNPMGMLYAAASTVSGGFFYMVSTKGSLVNDYKEAIKYAAQYEDLYAFVTYNQELGIRLYTQSVIEQYADPLIAQFKYGWFSALTTKERCYYEKDSTGSALIGSINANGVLTLANGDAIEGEVAIGDYVYVRDEYNAETGDYTELKYQITAVGSSQVTLKAGTPAHGATIVRFVDVLSNREFAEALAEEAKEINNHRISLVWADKLSFGGFEDVNRAVLCAILATQRSSLPPHAPMSDLAVPCITITDTAKFTDDEYNKLNAGGIWCVANDSQYTPITQHQITTKTDAAHNMCEENSIVSAGDAILRNIRTAIKPYSSGKSNVSDALLAAIRSQINAQAVYLKGIPYDSMYGPLLTELEIVDLYIPESNNAALVCRVRITLPKPMLDGTYTFNLV